MSEVDNVTPQTTQPSARHFNRLFLITLVFIAVLITVAEVVTQLQTRREAERVMIIGMASAQRHHSQRIVNKILQLSRPSEHARFQNNLTEIKNLFAEFETNHLHIEQGTVPGYPIMLQNSDSVKIRFQFLKPYYFGFRESVQRIIQEAEQVSSPEEFTSTADLTALLANETPFLENMDAVVQQYTRETLDNVDTTRLIEFTIYLFTLLALVFAGWYILRPAINKFEAVIVQLVEAETRTATTNRKLLSLNRALKETRQQLFDATRQQYQQQMDEQKLRTSYLVAGQEEERKRLSRELHDGIGQMLTAIKLQVESFERSLNGKEKETKSFVVLKDLIAQTIQETRNVSNNLMPTVLSDFGLIPAVKMLADSHDKNSKTDITFHTNLSNVRLDKSVEIGVYRIAQEAVSNALRHAEPTQITIDLFEKDNYLHLIVNDDGKGFRIHRSKKEDTKRPSQGIHNMHERAALINGKFKISSAPDKGTKVQVSIPFKLVQQEYEYTKVNAG
ncbi:sensor histidine kinase [Larkinella arboricola]|uniref:Signal transduction histidine kinase n=1 Tax=Larkinella arboricola TaxID=643671 RepID=A0A327X2T2_LARAB|nr:sensor histidine kinase [Larkinella arboricola]RAJ99874.1 signal transduction histidine kinase [Larkinella arboricola]